MIAHEPVAWGQCRRDVVQNVTNKTERATLRDVAMVCDTATHRPKLPQFILGNEHVQQHSELQYVRPTLAPNIIVQGRKTGWVDHNVMAEIYQTLGGALPPHMETFHPILHLDTVPCHSGQRLWRLVRGSAYGSCMSPSGQHGSCKSVTPMSSPPTRATCASSKQPGHC